MKSEITSISKPKWANAEHTMIDCEITISQFGSEVLPFTASMNDVEPHGILIFNEIVDGKYGPINEFVPTENVTQSV